MRKQFLWVRSPGLHYLAPGNIEFSQGDQGTLSFWYHPWAAITIDNVIWRLDIDDTNFAEIKWGPQTHGVMYFYTSSNGVYHVTEITDMDLSFDREWWVITATWDFTTPDAGVLHLYVNDRSEDSPMTTADAPVGTPSKFYVGGKSDSNNLGCCIDNLIIHNGVMTQQQHNARRGPADSFLALRNARRQVPQPDDCPGSLLFSAGFDGSYDAQIASGDATGYWDVSSDDYDQFALIDDGSPYKGRKLLLPLGMPRQDLSADDRLPGNAVLESFVGHGIGSYTTVVNDEDCTRIVISYAPPGVWGEGRGWLWEWLEPGNLEPPFTLRMRVNMPDDTNPKKYWTCLGPLLYYNGGMHGGLFGSWGTGDQFTVVADGSNTASSFKTNLGSAIDDYWVDAELSVVTGNCAPARLKVVSYDSTTKFITVNGALPDVPDGNSLCVVDFRGRLCPYATEIIEKQSMEAWLWEEYGGDRPWTELECQYDDTDDMRVVRYNRGRTAYMQFKKQRATGTAESGLMFGKNGTFGPYEGYSANIRLESIELDGPGNYQLLPSATSRYGRACSPSDNFMVVDPKTALSTRIWRCEGVEWHVQSPTKYSDPAQAVADLQAPGTWRETCELISIVYPQPHADQILALVKGTDSLGDERLGYLLGTFDGSRMTWTDETPPEGKDNPFMATDELVPTARSDSDWGIEEAVGGVWVFGLPDDTWAMVYAGSELNPDHYQARVLHGATDRWSFSYDEHYWPHNPIAPGTGGVDKLAPEYGGVNLWANRDAEWNFAYNQYTTEPSERFIAYTRGKTILADDDIGTNVRPLIGITSPDLKSFHPLPHGNMLSPLPAGRVHGLDVYTNGPDNMCLLVEFYGGPIRLWTSEDNLHFQQIERSLITGGELPGEPEDLGPGCTFRIGDYRIYYYVGADFFNYAYLKFNRETYYDLAGSVTAGYLETPILESPQDGWNDLYVNADPQQGSIRVEVIDCEDEQVVSGYSADDCDTITDGIEGKVTWNSARLRDLAQPHLRLRFYLERDSVEDDSPRLYAWQVPITAAEERPSASNPTVEGKTNPAGVTDPTPEFAWDYSDPNNSPQSAYHILVASSQQLLDDNTGDLWDSGPTESSETELSYAGDLLGELTTYFWKVRVRNLEGVWSEEW